MGGWVNKQDYLIEEKHRGLIAQVFSDVPLATNFENALEEVKPFISISNPKLHRTLTLGAREYATRLTYEPAIKSEPKLTNKKDNVPAIKL